MPNQFDKKLINKKYLLLTKNIFNEVPRFKYYFGLQNYITMSKLNNLQNE